MKISCVVLTHNSEKNLGSCLESIKWCDEILVIDDNSTDKTIKIARVYGARIFRKELNNNFSRQRNYGLSKASGDWVLFVDSDEVVPLDLQQEILQLLKSDIDLFDGYYIYRSDFWIERKLVGGENGGTWLLRLGKRTSGKWERRVHETWKIRGKTGKLRNELEHFPHETVGTFIDQINFHASLHARENREERKRASLKKVIFYPIGKFFVNFVLRGGWRDYTHGFVAAVIMSFHSFLAWAEYYQLQKKK